MLAVIIGAAIGGVSLVHLGSPLSIATRIYGLVFFPIVSLVSDIGLQFLTPFLAKVRLYNLAYLDVPQRAFATNALVAAFLVVLVCAAYFQPRYWCRNLCPAGALMGLFSRKAIIARRVNDACTDCGRCIRGCPMGAICDDPKVTAKAECIACEKCREVCPVSAIEFAPSAKNLNVAPRTDLTRRGVMLSLGAGLLGAGALHTNIHQARTGGKEKFLTDPDLLRPPGAVPEAEFLDKCMRCGECMKACPTNTLQPIWFQAGLEGIFSPVLLTRFAACATSCNVCGQVCPTGAIRNLPLLEKNHAKIGSAWINRRNCLVWEQDKKCLVCDEVCPYNAVSFRPVPGLNNPAPFAEENRCTGCGWCESKCPVNGASAIRVNVIGEVRLSTGSYVEKARESGFLFKPKDKAPEGLAPGTFDAPGDDSRTDYPESKDTSVPPGFTTK